MPAVEIRSLSKRFGAKLAVDDLSFDVEPGTVTGFLGPNGAGKSTALRALLDLIRPTAGSATFGGRRYRDLEDPVRTVGALLEDTSFHPGRSGRNHLRVLAHAAGIPAARVGEVLELVGLGSAGGQRVKGYSLGMRQRLGLAAALLGDPAVLVLDEPANGLDPEGVRWLRDLMRHQAAHGRAVLVSSHVLAEMAQSVDDVVVIAGGRLRAHAPLSELLAGRATPTVHVRAVERDRLATALNAGGAACEPLGEDGLRVRDTSAEAVGKVAVEQQIVLRELVTEEASLEDVFLELTAGETIA